MAFSVETILERSVFTSLCSFKIMYTKGAQHIKTSVTKTKNVTWHLADMWQAKLFGLKDRLSPPIPHVCPALMKSVLYTRCIETLRRRLLWPITVLIVLIQSKGKKKRRESQLVTLTMWRDFTSVEVFTPWVS